MMDRKLASLLALAVTLLSSSVAYADPLPEEGLGMPRDLSEYGHRIDWLISVTNWFVVILFVIMVVWMVAAVVKHNKDHEADYDHGDSKRHVGVAMGISALIFFVVDGNLWFNSTLDVNTLYWNFAEVEKKPDAVRIEINAHQWAWDARYPGPDGRFGTADDFTTLNDVRVPRGQPILMQLASADVIHSLFLPNLRIKQDATPGMINRMWFQAKKEGEVDCQKPSH